jgi:hypothetical protein
LEKVKKSSLGCFVSVRSGEFGTLLVYSLPAAKNKAKTGVLTP